MFVEDVNLGELFSGGGDDMNIWGGTWSELFEFKGSKPTVMPLTVTENGKYTAPAGFVYSPVTVDVSIDTEPDDGGDKPWEDLTWDQVVSSVKTGKYKTFSVGAVKAMDLGAEGTIEAQIVGIDADEKADGSGNAALSFTVKDLLPTDIPEMNPKRTPSAAPYDIGTGTIGGWEHSEARSYLATVIWPMIPANVRGHIVTVKKYSRTYDVNGNAVNNAVTEDKLWLLSRRELNMTDNLAETVGPRYRTAFPTDASRQKLKDGETTSNWWWLRSAGTAASFSYVQRDGRPYYYNVQNPGPYTFGFCL